MTITPHFTPLALLEELSLTKEANQFITQNRQTIQKIFTGEDPRLFLLVGPCSIHDPEAAYSYGEALSQLAADVRDKFFIIMRAYVEKPRTALGWKGFFYDPFLDGSYAMEEGARQTRQLFAALTALNLPLGAEILEMTTAPFYTDYLSWGCIGARTSASQVHRQMASGFPFPMGFKNSIDGNIMVAIQAILSAAVSHTFLGLSEQGFLTPLRTSGNPRGHLILRGSEQGPNYFPEDIAQAIFLCHQSSICSRLLIDCSHGNSGKQPQRQSIVFTSVLEQIHAGNRNIAGLMLESFLEEGNQPLTTSLRHGVSITDPCLSWPATAALIEKAYNRLLV